MKTLEIKENLKKNKGGVPTTLPMCQLRPILDCQTWYQIKAQTKSFYLIVQYANYLICIFMNINETWEIIKKIVES